MRKKIESTGSDSSVPPFVDIVSKSSPQARLIKDIVDGIQSYIGSLLNSPPSVLLRKVPHHNSMPSSRRLGLRRLRGLVVTDPLKMFYMGILDSIHHLLVYLTQGSN